MLTMSREAFITGPPTDLTMKYQLPELVKRLPSGKYLSTTVEDVSLPCDKREAIETKSELMITIRLHRYLERFHNPLLDMVELIKLLF